jgi:hypothetical protein
VTTLTKGDGRVLMRRIARLFLPGILAGINFMCCTRCDAQGVSIPYEETFDAAVPPLLPAGWRSSMVRSPGSPDFTCVTSSAYSAPHAVMAGNATVEQWLATPLIDCRTATPGRLSFHVRRSSTFGARCIVEASTDGGGTFLLTVGDAPGLGGGTSYVRADLTLPSVLAGCPEAVFRWHVLPDSTGATGTFRIDNVRIEASEPAIPPGTVVINEIQYQPVSGEPEWLELYNTGAAGVDLKDWTIGDASLTVFHRVTGQSCIIPAGDFSIVSADSVAFRGAWPGVQTMLLQPDGFPSLNNAGDLVILRNSRGGCMDSIWYQQQWGRGPGISLERIDPLSPFADGRAWGGSRDPDGATPGRPNSIVIQERDLLAGSLSLISAMLPASALLRFVVHNAGRQNSEQFFVRVLDDANRDSVGTNDDVVASAGISTELLSRDSLAVELAWSQPRPGSHQLITEIIWPADQRQENNVSLQIVQVAIPGGMIRINEIHAAPIGGTAEYVELTNCGTRPVDLTGCWIADRPLPSGSVNRWPVLAAPRLLPPGGFHVVAGDSAVPAWNGCGPDVCFVANTTGLGLNNEGDAVILRGPDGGVLDSVAYAAVWHSANIPDPSGRSLEKYHPDLSGSDPRSWGTCVHSSGGTPGRANRIVLSDMPREAALTCAPDPFSPDGDGFNDATVVRYRLSLRSALVRIKVFDIRGRCVRDLLNTDPAGITGEAVWDGFDNDRRPLRIGIYILYLEAIDGVGGTIVAAKKAVVLARRL